VTVRGWSWSQSVTDWATADLRLRSARPTKAEWRHGSGIARQGLPGDRRQPRPWVRRGPGTRRRRGPRRAQRSHQATAAAAATRLAQNAAAADSAAWVAADNADPATPGRLIAAAKERFGRLDGALLSVGGTPTGTVATTTDQAWRSGFETVFLGTVRLVRTLATALGGERRDGGAAGSMTGTGGAIVLVLASSVRVPLPDLAISNGLFPGLADVVKTLADEVGPTGIRINGVLPVRIATDRVRELDALRGDPDEERARQSAHIPLRRYGEPEEFGRAAAFLLSPAASFITGAMIPVDGGAIRSI
jgi:3-oxoacyl-[acyl-carrier protein] reductase